MMASPVPLEPGFVYLWTFIREDKLSLYADLLVARGLIAEAEKLRGADQPVWVVGSDPAVDPPWGAVNGWVMAVAEADQMEADLGGLGTVNKGTNATNFAYMRSDEPGGANRVPPEGWDNANVFSEGSTGGRKPDPMFPRT